MTGHQSLSARQVTRILLRDDSGEATAETVSAGVDSLLRRLAELGRPFASVRAVWDTTEADDSLEVMIGEGPEVRAEEVRLVESGDRDTNVTLREVARVELTPDALRREIRAALRRYADSGYPFASVTAL